MNTSKIRDYIRFSCALLCSPWYLFHLLAYVYWGKSLIDKDVERTETDSLKLKGVLGVLYLLHNDRWFPRLFYHRIGPKWALLISWMRPGDKSFILSYKMTIGAGVKIAHPYSTVLNAESIGKNFTCIHLTTLGKTAKGRPTIGDNVTLGANVTIIGPAHIGNNVTIGAGSVVVKDIPDNSVAVGNPARVIKTLSPIDG